MSYALATIWYERQRFLPAVLAVAFSCLLIALQVGLLVGLFSVTSIPIDNSSADLWVTHPEVAAVDLGRPIPEAWQSYLNISGIERIEPYLQAFCYWDKPTGGMELCLVIGTRLGPDAFGPIRQLTTSHRTKLAEIGAVVVDRGEFGRLGITKVGQTAEINGKRVRVVGTVTGLRSLAGPYVFCSVETARTLIRPPADQVTFLLGKTSNRAEASKIADRLHGFPKKFTAYTAEDFSFRSRWHWLTKTKAGIALGLAACLGLLVGAVVTSQTLYSATAASLKEYAVLRALGIPRWRMSGMVLLQAFWVGIAGIAVAVPAILGMAYFGNEVGAKIILAWWIWTGAISVTLAMALLSGLLALRSLQMVEPVTLLR